MLNHSLPLCYLAKVLRLSGDGDVGCDDDGYGAGLSCVDVEGENFGVDWIVAVEAGMGDLGVGYCEDCDG